jgi:hypothetical protein
VHATVDLDKLIDVADQQLKLVVVQAEKKDTKLS